MELKFYQGEMYNIQTKHITVYQMALSAIYPKWKSSKLCN